MTVYLVITEDRHSGTVVEAFAEYSKASERAKAIVAEYGYTPDEPDTPVMDWLFNATLSSEGDCVHIEAVEVRE